MSNKNYTRVFIYLMEKYPISKKPGQKASLSYQQQWRKNSNSVLSVQIERKKKKLIIYHNQIGKTQAYY